MRAGGAPPATARRRSPRGGAVVKARTPKQSVYIRAMESTTSCFGIGPAGTGKTYLAVAYAAHCLERGIVERIILSRPAVEAGERLGFLPGDMREKVDPYLRPLYDALYDVLPPEKVERDIETGVIEIAPLAFMRGRTLANAFVILDEAQNTTSMQMKMFLTRIGEKAPRWWSPGILRRSICRPGLRSGLEEAVGLLAGVTGIEIVRFTTADIVRRDLVARIVEAYEGSANEERRALMDDLTAPGSHEMPETADKNDEPPPRLVLEAAHDAGDWSSLAPANRELELLAAGVRAGGRVCDPGRGGDCLELAMSGSAC